VPSPFSIDSGSVPASLEPGGTALFAVGFRPTMKKLYHDKLVIDSPQLAAPLEIELVGEGVAGLGGSNDEDDLDTTSFYSCGCASGHGGAPGAVVVAVAAIVTLRRRRR
jgi:MYXO-CTERM domain-containing protein